MAPKPPDPDRMPNVSSMAVSCAGRLPDPTSLLDTANVDCAADVSAPEPRNPVGAAIKELGAIPTVPAAEKLLEADARSEVCPILSCAVPPKRPLVGMSAVGIAARAPDPASAEGLPTRLVAIVEFNSPAACNAIGDRPITRLAGAVKRPLAARLPMAANCDCVLVPRAPAPASVAATIQMVGMPGMNRNPERPPVALNAAKLLRNC